MSQVNWKFPLILASILFGLGLFAVWHEYKFKPAQETAEEQSKKIFVLKDIPTQGIQIVDGAKNFQFTCSDLSSKLCKPGDNSKWELSEPIKVKADDANVNSLLSSLNSLNPNETISLKEETPEKRSALLKEYGVDADSRKTLRKVSVKTEKGESSLFLGNMHPIGETQFAIKQVGDQVDENTIYLIPTYFKNNLDHDLTHWRNKKLFTLASHEVESFKLDGSKSHVSGEKKDGQWTLHMNNEDLAGDIENIDNLLTTATHLNAKNFASNNKEDATAKAALAGYHPVLTLSLQKEKGADKDKPLPITFTLFQKKVDPAKGKLYATISNLDPLFEIEAGTKDRLDKPIKDLRLNKLITAMERFAAKKIELSGAAFGATPFVLENKDGKWINSADKTEVPSDRMQNFLDKISGNKIKDFLTGSEIPAGEKEGLKFVLADDKSPTKRQLLFWKAKQGLYAKDLNSKRNEAFLVEPSIKEDLPWNPDYFKKPEPKPSASPEIPKK